MYKTRTHAHTKYKSAQETEFYIYFYVSTNRDFGLPKIENDPCIFDEKTERARRLLFILENTLRVFVDSKLDVDKRIKESFLRGWKSSKKKEKDRYSIEIFRKLKKIFQLEANSIHSI